MSTRHLTCRPLGYAGSLITLRRLAGLMMADNNRGVSSRVQPGGPQPSPTQWSGVSVLRYNLADCQGPPGVFCFSRRALHVCYFKYKTWRAVKAQVWCMTPIQINLWPTLLWIVPNEKKKKKHRTKVHCRTREKRKVPDVSIIWWWMLILSGLLCRPSTRAQTIYVNLKLDEWKRFNWCLKQVR